MKCYGDTIFVTTLNLSIVSTWENIVSSSESDNPSLIVNYFVNLWHMLRALALVVQKILAFGTTKNYFIYFTILLYKTPNINSFILVFNTLK